METCGDLKLRAECFLWTDASIVLGWLQRALASLDVFVKNRVTEILSITSECSWRYCPGETNPADMLTRGVSLDALAAEVDWRQGPAWLSEDSEKWPAVKHSLPQINDILGITATKPTTLPSTGNAVQLTPLLDATKFSSLRKLLRVTAWVQRFVSNVKCKI